jgi:hypothetical protein
MSINQEIKKRRKIKPLINGNNNREKERDIYSSQRS